MSSIPIPVLTSIDWIRRTTTEQRKNGIRWTLWTQLDDLDFADDLALLSHSYHQMQDKINTLIETSSQVGLNIHEGKTKNIRINTTTTEPITLGDTMLEEVESFTYLGSIISSQGGTDADVKARIGKARTSFLLLKNIWNSREIRETTKIRIFNSNVKSVLLYGAETWRINKITINKVQTFINKCLRRILKSTGRTRSATTICGQEQNNPQQQTKLDEEDGDRSGTHYANQCQTPPDRL